MDNFTFQIIALKNKNKVENRTLVVSGSFPLYFLIEIKHPERPQNALAYRIINILKEKFQQPNKTNYQKLEEALKEINLILQKLLAEGEVNLINNLSAIIVLFEKGQIHLASLGATSCFLIRDKNITEITASAPEGAFSKSFSDILSGELAINDKIILGNQVFFESLPLNFLRQTFSNYAQKEAAFILANSLRREKVQNAAGLLIQVKPLTANKKEEKQIIYLDEKSSEKILTQATKIIPKISGKFPPKHLYQGKNWQKFFKPLLITIALVAGIILSAIMFKAAKQKYQQVNENTRKVIMQAEDKKRAGDEAQKVNNKQLAENLYKEAIALAEQVNNKESRNLIAIINNEIDAMFHLIKVKPKEILDLSFLQDSEVSQIYSNGKDIFFVDKKTARFYQNKNEKTTLPHSAGSLVAGTYQPQEDLIILYLDKEGIFEYNIKENQLKKGEIIFGEHWENAQAIATYFTNVYLLDAKSGQILKHEKTAAGYSKAIPYNNTDKLNLSSAISFALDGYIYALNQDGSIVKLMAGKPVAGFKVSGIPETDSLIKNPRKIATSVDAPYLYLLSGSNIVVLNKDGGYVQTYVTPFSDITDFVLNYKNKVLYLLANNKVYKIEI